MKALRLFHTIEEVAVFSSTLSTKIVSHRTNCDNQSIVIDIARSYYFVTLVVINWRQGNDLFVAIKPSQLTRLKTKSRSGSLYSIIYAVHVCIQCASSHFMQ